MILSKGLIILQWKADALLATSYGILDLKEVVSLGRPALGLVEAWVQSYEVLSASDSH